MRETLIAIIYKKNTQRFSAFNTEVVTKSKYKIIIRKSDTSLTAFMLSYNSLKVLPKIIAKL